MILNFLFSPKAIFCRMQVNLDMENYKSPLQLQSFVNTEHSVILMIRLLQQTKRECRKRHFPQTFFT